MNPREAAEHILELDREFEEVDGNSQEEEMLQREYEDVCASHGAQLAEALQAAEGRERRYREVLKYIAEFPKTQTPNETHEYSLIGTRDDIIEIAREALER